MYKYYSVLSTVYEKDSPEYISQSIESMINQTVCPSEYIIIIDGPVSTGISDILNVYCNKYDYIKTYQIEENHGLGYALAYGVQKCRNELIARLDSDDISLPTRCEKQLKLFNEKPELDIVGTYMYEFIDDPCKPTSMKHMPVSYEEIYNAGKRKNPFNHSSVMYKKASVLKYGNYKNLRRGQDIDLFTRMLRNGARGENIPEPLVLFRANADQYSRRVNKNSSKVILSTVRENYKKRYATKSDLVYIYAREYFGRICPKWLGKILYRKLSREKINIDISQQIYKS